MSLIVIKIVTFVQYKHQQEFIHLHGEDNFLLVGRCFKKNKVRTVQMDFSKRDDIQFINGEKNKCTKMKKASAKSRVKFDINYSCKMSEIWFLSLTHWLVNVKEEDD